MKTNNNLQFFLKELEKAKDRDRLIFLTLFETGCSCSELAKIKIADFFSSKKQDQLSKIVFHNPKRNSIISETLGKIILSYIKTAGKTSNNYLFSSKDKPISVKRIEQLANEIFSTINPQQIRYLHVIYAAQKGLSLDSIAMQTGLKKQRIMQILDSANIKQMQSYSIFLKKKIIFKESEKNGM